MLIWEDITSEGIYLKCEYNQKEGIYTVTAKKGEKKFSESFEQNFQPTNGIDNVDFATSISIGAKLTKFF